MNNYSFRLFISSTFSDFSAEREVLQVRVFPRIREYCREEGGFSFQPIDLRWGISQEAQLNQRTLELCLNEVRTCKTHPAPNFLIMASDRYGWIPLPYLVEKEELEILIPLMSGNDRKVILDWYELDKNQIPASYLLKERSGEFVDGNRWSIVENQLLKILQEALNKSHLADKARQEYFLSATEAEVCEGILDYAEYSAFQQDLIDKGFLDPDFDRQNVFAFIRNIEDSVPDSLFTDADPAQSRRFKNAVQSLVPHQLEVMAHHQSKDILKGDYLEEFELAMITFLEERVRCFSKEIKIRTAKETEVLHHLEYAEEKLNFFQGREESRRVIASYIDGVKSKVVPYPDRPLIVYGPSGMGKSSLVAKAAREAGERENVQVIQRYAGATPTSTSTISILLSLFEELGVDTGGLLPEKDNIAEDLKDKTPRFDDFCDEARSRILTLPNQGKTIVLFLDAVDQLDNEDRFLWLPHLLPEHIKIVISALEDEHYSKESNAFTQLHKRSLNYYSLPVMEQPLELLRSILESHHRKLQAHQEEYFLKQYGNSASPLYVSLAAQELQFWKSHDRVESHDISLGTGSIQGLADSQKGLIAEYISNLYELFHHDKNFVRTVLGYLHASKSGLSESELLQLISAEPELVRKLAPDTWHRNPTGELPTVIWSRLYAQLSPFLSRTTLDGEELIRFFHREFFTVIEEQEGQAGIHRRAITACQKMVKEVQFLDFDSTRWGKLYVTLVTEYELRYPDDSRLEEDAAFVSGLVDESSTEELESFIKKLVNYSGIFGINLNKINKSREAIIFQEYCIIVLKPLYESNPDRWVKNYTRSLNNLALSFKDIGKTKEAFVLQVESLSIRKPLYESNPEYWTEGYTDSLNNLALSFKDIGKTNEAIVLQKESLSITKSFFVSNPDHWAEKYTKSLNNLASLYSDIGKTKESIALEEENLSIIKTFYELHPERWVESYSISLNNLAFSYRVTEKMNESITLDEECLSIRKTLYELHPERWVELYSTSLNNLASSYCDIGKIDEAITLEEENLSITKTLYESYPERWVRNYTISLNSLAVSYQNIGKTIEAITFQEESLSIIKLLYESHPEHWAEGYSYSINNLALSYSDIGKMNEAISLQEENMSIIESLYNSYPVRWTVVYTRLLNNLAVLYKDIGKTNDAITLLKECLSIIKLLYESHPERWVSVYIRSLNNLASTYKKIGKVVDAIELEKSHKNVYKKLLEIDPKNQEYLTRYLNLLFKLELYEELQNELEIFKAKKDIQLNIDILFLAGQTAFIVNEFSRAQEYFESIIQNNKKDEIPESFYLWLGFSYLKQFKYEAAEKVIFQAIKENNEDKRAYLGLTKIYLEHYKDFSKAIENYEIAEKIGSLDEYYLYYGGLSYLALYKEKMDLLLLNKSEDCFKQALFINREHEESQEKLKEIAALRSKD